MSYSPIPPGSGPGGSYLTGDLVTPEAFTLVRDNFEDHENRIVAAEGDITALEAADVVLASGLLDRLALPTVYKTFGMFPIGSTSSATWQGVNCPNGSATANTQTDITSTSFWGYSIAPAAGQNNFASLGLATLLFGTQVNPVVEWLVRTPSDITSIRLDAIMSSTQVGVPGDAHQFGFCFDTSNGDTGWKGIVNNGTAANVRRTANLNTLQASTVYRLRARVTGNGTGVAFSVNGGAETSLTQNLPTVTQKLGMIFVVVNLAAGGRSFGIGSWGARCEI